MMLGLLLSTFDVESVVGGNGEIWSKFIQKEEKLNDSDAREDVTSYNVMGGGKGKRSNKMTQEIICLRLADISSARVRPLISSIIKLHPIRRFQLFIGAL